MATWFVDRSFLLLFIPLSLRSAPRSSLFLPPWFRLSALSSADCTKGTHGESLILRRICPATRISDENRQPIDPPFARTDSITPSDENLRARNTRNTRPPFSRTSPRSSAPFSGSDPCPCRWVKVISFTEYRHIAREAGRHSRSNGL